jgi:uncharacterized membrane-anchored protein
MKGAHMKTKLLIAVLALQAAWILGTTLVQERALAGGTVILLKTRPVDPRDLLRGDYVILNYDISDVALSAFSPPRTNAPPFGEDVYVALEPRGQFYEIAQASSGKITPGPGQVVLRGQSRPWWIAPGQKTVHVEYGLEKYFVREGTGNPRGQITVRVAVPASGQGRIKEVLLDGKPYVEAMRAAQAAGTSP